MGGAIDVKQAIMGMFSTILKLYKVNGRLAPYLHTYVLRYGNK